MFKTRKSDGRVFNDNKQRSDKHHGSVKPESGVKRSDSNIDKIDMGSLKGFSVRFKNNPDNGLGFYKKADGTYRLEVGIGMLADHPIRYENGHIGYYYPELVPSYIKQKVEQIYKHKNGNDFTEFEIKKILNDDDFVHGIRGHGYFVEYYKSRKDGSAGSKRVTKSFATPEEAIAEGLKLQDGHSTVRIIDGTGVVVQKQIGSINLSGKFNEGYM